MLSGFGCPGVELEIAIGEGGVTEAVAEGVEGSAFIVAIGAVLHRIFGERGKVVEAGVEGEGEAAGGIVPAAEGLGDGSATFFAGIPGFEDGGGVLLGPVDGDGAAVHEDNDEGFTCGCDGLEELLLGSG